ncbi:hypothetical protein SRB5_56470 [Streptomyces sp. RB5]|uniref:Integral membrane protein n=1 Tax=Streptomyces smaragdinus TaxID=2585196 RepID=A0A7K0CPQ4_9ACTN|nr:hypothetical protein [Streptomyces smaragdinus]MQY15465.1 hypothetical protein [Streptomyces smaragdinus]
MKSPGVRNDILTAVLAAVLFALAAVVGSALLEDRVRYRPLLLKWPPLYAQWMPHMGPGTGAAVLVAVVVVVYGPSVAVRLPWRRLLWVSWLVSMAWLWSLALIDGWSAGVAGQLTDKNEYLHDGLSRFSSVGDALRTYTDYISADTAPDNWPAHIAGHPPGAVLTFVGLDRLGLGGGAWGAVFVLTVGGSAAAAVLVALRALGSEDAARRAAPFLVLAPWAVWAGVSADGYFAAVGAWGVALVAVACSGVRPWASALCGGLLLGWCVYLSYGLTLLALLVLAALWVSGSWRPVPWVVLGVCLVAVGFTASGFWWWEGYTELHARYYAGAAGFRPYGYFVWANLATVVVSAGLASVAGVRRAVVGFWRGMGPGRRPSALPVLVVAAAAAILAADLSGMSKAETERIWLPFTLWLLPAAALLPPATHRWWLASQAVLAVGVNGLLLTGW